MQVLELIAGGGGGGGGGGGEMKIAVYERVPDDIVEGVVMYKCTLFA